MKKQLLALVAFLQISLLSSAATPVVAFNGYQETSICSGQYYYIVSGMEIADMDGDNITFTGATSSHPGIIDANDLYVYIGLNSGTPDYQCYVDVGSSIGNVGSNTNVTVTLNFTDGTSTLPVQIVYTVKPSPNPVFLETSYTMCSSEGVVDVNEWVYPQGGYFKIDGEQSFYDGYFHTEWVDYGFNLGYVYEAANGCEVEVSVDVDFYESPEIELYTTNSSSCVSGDGAIDASIYSPSETNYTYVWNDGNTTETDRTGMLPGSYHIDVTDENGCVAEATGSILLDGVLFNEVIDTVTCHNDNDGAIQLNITGLTAPLQLYWSSGQTAQSISGLTAGNYTVYLTDATGCSFSKTFEVPNRNEIYVYADAYGPTSCLASDGYISVMQVDGGNGDYTLDWSNGGDPWFNSPLDAGIYDLTVTDGSGCTYETYYILNDQTSPYPYLEEIIPSTCGLADGAINLDTNGIGIPFNFDWSGGFLTLDLIDVPADIYDYHAVSLLGCDYYERFEVPVKAPALQPLCMITVDSATTTNLVVWEKVEPASVDYYKIYRETVNPEEFVVIDTVQNSNESIFNDVMASPIAQSWRYKISAVNECGVESPLSMAHKTMHITTIDLGNGADFQAVWNPYYGTDYDHYILYRYTATTGWEEIATLPSVVNSYIDTPPNSVDLDYMVELDVNFDCVASVEKMQQDFNTTRSNKDKGNFIPGQGTGDSNNDVLEQEITMNVYPNPVADVLTVEVSENGTNKNMYLVTVEGQVIQQIRLTSVSQTVDVSALSNGLYFLKIEGQNTTVPVVKN